MFFGEAKLIRHCLSGVANAKVLNLGSSTAEFYKHRQPYIWEEFMLPVSQDGNTVINVDRKNGNGVDIVADCHDLPVGDQLIEVVVCASMLEHVSDPMKILAEIRRVLKPNGFAIITAPGEYPIHPDPIDTGLRLPTLQFWYDLLGPTWTVTLFAASFEKRRDMPTCPNQYSTLVVAWPAIEA